jgi:hypothetical protein
MAAVESRVCPGCSRTFIPLVDRPTCSACEKGAKRLAPLMRRLEALSKDQLELLSLLLSAGCAVVCIGEDSYAVRRADSGWVVRKLTSYAAEYAVAEDFSSCSCPDSRFREHPCKHCVALKKLFGRRL